MPEEQKNDHDILIVIQTQVARLIDDVKTLNGNLAGKIEKLESSKADKIEIALLHSATLGRLEKLEPKVEALEQYRYTVAGALIVALFLIQYVIKKFF